MSRSSGSRTRCLPLPLNVPVRTPSPTSAVARRGRAPEGADRVRASASRPPEGRRVTPLGDRHDQQGWSRGVESVTSPRYVAGRQAPAPAEMLRQPIGPAGPEGTYIEVCGASRRVIRRQSPACPAVLQTQRRWWRGPGPAGTPVRGDFRALPGTLTLCRAILPFRRGGFRVLPGCFSRSSRPGTPENGRVWRRSSWQLTLGRASGVEWGGRRFASALFSIGNRNGSLSALLSGQRVGGLGWSPGARGDAVARPDEGDRHQ